MSIIQTKIYGRQYGNHAKNKDKVYFQGVYHAGDTKSAEYVPDMFISVGRPKNVEVYVKGIKKNLLAKRRKTNIPVDSLE